MKIFIAVLLCGAAGFSAAAAFAKNGFDLSDTQIPADEIFHGGPPRDGIPAINNPVFAAAKNAAFMREDDLILGIAIDEIARAYPIKILNWHEIVNDEINGAAVAITFCPLCGSGVVFAAEIRERRLQFGVSGLLYKSDVLLYDRETDSLWSQLLRKGISGEYAGQKLQTIPVQHTTWREWRKLHPQTEVLTTDTGARRDYDENPYAGYDKSAAIYFPVPDAPNELHPKEWILGLSRGEAAKAYPFSEIAKTGETQLRDTIGGAEVVIHWNAAAQSAHAEWQNDKGESVRAFWFAWYAFHPQTEIFRAP